MTNRREPNFAAPETLLPAVVQHAETGHVLMVAYMNRESYEATLTSGRVTFFSRSKNRLWTKGESSGNFLDLREMRIDCDEDAILIKAIPRGPTCHTGDDTCFGEHVPSGIGFLEQLAKTIHERRACPSAGSYTSELFLAGTDRLAQKVGEEGVEVVIAAKNPSKATLCEESADLIFHLMVLLESRECSLADVVAVLRARAEKAKKSLGTGDEPHG